MIEKLKFSEIPFVDKYGIFVANQTLALVININLLLSLYKNRTKISPMSHPRIVLRENVTNPGNSAQRTNQ